MDNEVEELEK